GSRPGRSSRGSRSERGDDRSRRGRSRRQNGRASSSSGPRSEGASRIAETIDDSDGREFWEAWVDSKSEGAEAPPAEGVQDAAAEGVQDAAAEVRRGPGPDEVRLYLNIGRRDRVRRADVIALLEQKGLTASAVEVRSSFTYLIVPAASEATFTSALTGGKQG